ncbi:hypothetical protein [Nocardioides sp. B-3]|uniref:hypothetical protein n=1 Tax=Nocardioides sp. B-3 TaxID=2895565 RepID=UPI0021538C9C|nr:hypothetical protein [Nocardioides sp. B-3]UUZ61532.1 hypothetical protein LP418_13815 [Nocardioides sp. B-3]
MKPWVASPLSRTRAELPEDIMATTPVESVSDHSVRRPRRRGTLLAVGTAAATVAALFAVPALLGSGDDPAAEDPGRSAEQQLAAKNDSSTAAEQPPAATGNRILLPGWTISYTTESETERETEFTRGAQSVSVHQRNADDYAGYLDDRRHITNPPTDGEPVSVPGKAARLWPYSADDHAALAEVDGPRYVEVRGSGMGKTAFSGLLEQLAYVNDEEYTAALPETFVTEDQQSVVLEMMADMPTPPTQYYQRPDGPSRYQLGVSAAGSVACARLDEIDRRDRQGGPGSDPEGDGGSLDQPRLGDPGRDECRGRLPRGGVGARRPGPAERGPGGLPGSARLPLTGVSEIPSP